MLARKELRVGEEVVEMGNLFQEQRVRGKKELIKFCSHRDSNLRLSHWSLTQTFMSKFMVWQEWELHVRLH